MQWSECLSACLTELATSLFFYVDHVVAVEFKGPSTVGTPGMSHSVAHSALVGPCHFLFWLPEKY